MLVVLIGLILFLMGMFFLVVVKITDDMGINVLGWLVTVIGGGWLLLALIVLPFQRMSVHAFISEFEATRAVINDIRENPELSPFERLELQKVVIGKNEELARNQYYSRNIWTRWYYPKEIQQTRPIKNFERR